MFIAIITAAVVGLAAIAGAQTVGTEVDELRRDPDPTPTTDTKIHIEVDEHEAQVTQEVRFRVKQNLHEATESAEIDVNQRLDRAQERTEGKFNDAIERVREKSQEVPEEYRLETNRAEQELRQAKKEVLDALEHMRR